LLPEALHVAIVLSPFGLLPAAGWLGARGSNHARFLALVPAVLTAYFGFTYWRVSTTGAFTATLPWATNLGLSLSFHFDGLSLMFATLIAAIGALIVGYAVRYLDGHRDAAKFHVSLFAFMGAMLGVVLADNVLTLFVFWELTGFTSYLLIGFEYDKPKAREAALQALLVTGAGGLALLGAGILMANAGGTSSLSVLRGNGSSFTNHPAYAGMAILVLFAAFTKSAQFPFHFWLPNAMQAPTPVSAYLHSATMVKAGVYLIARMTPLLGGTALWGDSIAAVGALTMLGASYRAVLETDLKRILAYSTIGALGVMMLLLGLGTPQAVTAALTYLLAHACYKGALFLVAGAVEYETGTRDIRSLAGLARAMPKTALAAISAAASMGGIVLFFGFIAKEQLYESVGAASPFGIPAAVLLAVAVASSMLLGSAGFIAGVSPFIGQPAPGRVINEPPASLWSGPLILGAVGLVAGLAPAMIDRPLGLAVASIIQNAPPVSLAIWHGFTGTLSLSVLTSFVSVGLFVFREPVRRMLRPRALRTERVYTGALAGLDAISRTVAPALQSASLRSYALIVVVTGVALVAAALVTNRVLPTLSRWTPIALHEAVVAGLIVAAALSAAVARSNMAAALSLGAVGYGVALMYALFGAPDLAMTQFAVETLTVVIFVLVFYQLRGFGDLSSRIVKARDALVAIAAGSVITVLALFIGASGTTSRLSAYFAEMAPTQAHGRNIVNVILVDFRGFDTLGETTVLVTVAIGVRALLLIGRERRS
jgi:multicomponent Na+:H+ antiporter subunit A